MPGAWEKLSPNVRHLIEGLRRDPTSALAEIEERVQWYAVDPLSILAPGWAGPGDPDDELMARSEIVEPMKREMLEGARQGSAGYVGDWVAENLPWGFSISEVQQEVSVWWGEEDRLVTRPHTEYLASTIPRSSLVIHPGEGHLALLAHWEEILASLL